MKNQVKVAMENNGDMIFTVIPVEHLVVNSIDRLGNYLLIYIPFLQLDVIRMSMKETLIPFVFILRFLEL